jgi:hypothetical protein
VRILRWASGTSGGKVWVAPLMVMVADAIDTAEFAMVVRAARQVASFQS